MKEERRPVIVGMTADHKPIVEYLTEDEIKERRKPKEHKVNKKSKYDPDIVANSRNRLGGKKRRLT